MSVILLQDKWRRQPSGPAVLAPEWAKGARFVVSAGSGRVNLANGLPSIPGSRGISPSIGGLGLDYSSTADTPTNTGIDSFESSVNVTIFSCFIVRTAVAWSACIYDRGGWNGGAFGDDGLSYRYVWDGSEWSYSTGLTFGTNRVVAAAHSISANSAICAVDGRTDTRSVSNSARGFQNFANWFGSDPNGGRNLNGVILLAGICVGESWSGPRLQEWTKNPWQIFRKQPRILYFTAPSGGGATLTVQDLAQGHSLGSPSLTEHNVLAVQGLGQAHTLGAPTLTQHNVLVVNALGQAQLLGAPTLTQAHVLVAQDVSQAQSLGLPSLTQAYALIVQAMSQAHLLGEPALTQHNILVVDALGQAQILGAPSLTAAGALAVDALAQAQSLGLPSLVQHHVLAVDALAQAQAFGSPSLTQAHILTPDALAQAQTTGNVSFTIAASLAVQAIAQAQAFGSPDLAQHHVLTPDAMVQAQQLADAALTQHGALSVDGMTQAQALDALALTQHFAIVVQSLLQGQEIGTSSLTANDVLTVAGITQAQILEIPGLTQHAVLAVDGLTQAQILGLAGIGGAIIGIDGGTIVCFQRLGGRIVASRLGPSIVAATLH